jgi:hypothetical protein
MTLQLGEGQQQGACSFQQPVVALRWTSYMQLWWTSSQQKSTAVPSGSVLAEISSVTDSNCVCGLLFVLLLQPRACDQRCLPGPHLWAHQL